MSGLGTTHHEDARPLLVAHPRGELSLSTRTSLAILIVTYLGFALTFTFLTRAWEADDESAHVQYVEYIVAHHSIPRISPANNAESHQPPLYYLAAAAWQTVLHIPTFRPDPVIRHINRSELLKELLNRGSPRLAYNHDYNAAEHRHAVDVHEIRLISVALGLVTVLSTYAAARVLRLRESIALSAGLFVALLPRELVIASSVTNDALVIPLCWLALLCFLMARRFGAQGRANQRRWSTIGMGVFLGAAAITKFNSLPVAAVLFAATFLSALALPTTVPTPLPEAKTRRIVTRLDLGQVMDGGLAVLAFLVVSGWWFIRNKSLYGQFLATSASQTYLRTMLFYVIPAPSSSYLVEHELPDTLWWTLWYLQPGSSLPFWINDLLIVGAIVCFVGAIWALLIRPERGAIRARFVGATLFALIVAGILAVFLIIKSVGTSDARLAYVALSAWAITLVYGATTVSTRFVPACLPMCRLFGLPRCCLWTYT